MRLVRFLLLRVDLIQISRLKQLAPHSVKSLPIPFILILDHLRVKLLKIIIILFLGAILDNSGLLRPEQRLQIRGYLRIRRLKLMKSGQPRQPRIDPFFFLNLR